jgi:hypothetical protein
VRTILCRVFLPLPDLRRRLVTAKLLTPENFRGLTFVNPAMMHLSMNPDYFKGTVVEDAATALLKQLPEKQKAS